MSKAKPQPAQTHDLIVPWRFWLVVAALSLLPIALILRLAFIQVIPSADQGFEFLQQQGESRSVRTVEMPAFRGLITDRNGVPLAVSTPMATIIANPRAFYTSTPENQQGAKLNALAKALELNARDLKNRFNANRSRQFLYVARKQPPQMGEAVRKLRIRGISIEKEYKRFYPAGETAAHIVGFTGIDDAGQEGIELAYESVLAGRSGKRTIARDLYGNMVRDFGVVESPERGNDVSLTIDMRLQYVAYRELKSAVKRHQAKGGSVVVVDVTSGEILAMANQPSFNPNNRATFKPGATRNRALTDIFEPGSTFKPLTMTVALEDPRYTPDTVINTHPGWIRVDGKTLLDPVNYGEMDLTKIITKSSQVGTTKLALSLEHEDIRNRFDALGFGRATSIGFPAESSGLLPYKSRWSDIERANQAFGYGLSVTAAQLASAYATLGNDGKRLPLSLINADNPYADEPRQVVSPKVSKQVVAMMETVTSAVGSGKRARIPGYRVAGKTGTAHKVGASGYLGTSYRALFAGVAPAENPRLAVVVVIDEPTAGGHYGGEVAAPAFAKVTADALRLLNVAPSNSTSIN